MDKMRSVNTRFWIDNWVLDLDPVEKLLFVYLLTNQSTNLAGIYELHLRKMAFETGIDREMVQKILTRFETDKKVIYRHGYVFILNFTKHQAYNGSMLINVKQTIDNLPDEVKNDSLLTPCLHPVYTLYTPIGEIEMEIEKEIERESEGEIESDPAQLLFSNSKISLEDIKELIQKTEDLSGADAEYYYNRALDWSQSKGERKKDWLAAIRSWIRLDVKEGKLNGKKTITNDRRNDRKYL